ncbi:P-loop NTPase fold protein [Ascidiaceihabitans sp.]|uniref:P-loop NTPase fold protein n=1 Tax=Ascidiaceihabitans sp. TaxID=1872644 RepID=UPI003298F001
MPKYDSAVKFERRRMPNSIATQILNDYLVTPDPRYALLINAPWGAGKTAFIKHQTKYETDRKFLYLSLFGIDSVEAFNEALLAAIINSPGNETVKTARQFGEKLKDIASSSHVMGFSINLSSLSLLEGLKKYLPHNLIFDDLERISMPQTTMSGLLNQFIEHDKRRVILIANTDGIVEGEKEAFDTTKEKRIGQTIEILPDVEAVLQSFWVDIPSGRGKIYLREHQDLIKEVFGQGGHKNLRLLRYAMRATAALLDKTGERFFAFERAFETLVRTFLALHMAYGGGLIGKDELRDRGNSKAFGESMLGKATPEDAVPSLIALEIAHPECDIRIPSNGSPLNVDLGWTLITQGYASAELINQHLDQSHHFRDRLDDPNWIKLFNWECQPINELTGLLEQLTAKLQANEITNPGEFIQIYGAIDFLVRLDGLEETREELAERFIGYIDSLVAAKKIRPRSPSSRWSNRHVFAHDMGRVSYGGYSFEPDEITSKVVERLKEEMDAAYNANLSNSASALLDTFETTPEAFLNQLDYSQIDAKYASAPILHLVDKDRFAERFLDLIQTDRETAMQLAERLKSRRQEDRIELKDERGWINDLEEILQTKASARSKLGGAQVKFFVRQRL